MCRQNDNTEAVSRHLPSLDFDIEFIAAHQSHIERLLAQDSSLIFRPARQSRLRIATCRGRLRPSAWNWSEKSQPYKDTYTKRMATITVNYRD